MMYDILFVGGGPAGLSADVNAAARGKRCAVLSNDYRMNPLFRSEKSTITSVCGACRESRCSARCAARRKRRERRSSWDG